MREAIQADRLSFSYEKAGEEQTAVAVFDDFSVTLEDGSFVAIIGRNGCGKSTFAKLCNAVLLPCGGVMRVYGMDASEDNLLDIRQRVGMVFQNPDNQIVSNVVEEDVAFAPENLGVPSEEIRRRVDEALRIVGMQDYAQHAPHLLSGGQKQRIAIAGVLAMHPKCIVLDEATAMLDPQGRREVMETIRRLNREQHVTVLLITHHMREAMEADRVIVLHRGGVLFDGPPETVFSHVETLREAGLDAPETVQLLYRLREAGVPVRLDAMSVEDCAQEIYRFCRSGRNTNL